MMRAKPLAVVAAVTGLGGCGGATDALVETTNRPDTTSATKIVQRSVSPPKRCNPAGRTTQGRLTLCTRRINTDSAGRFWVRRAGESRRLAVRRPMWPGTRDHLNGLWQWAAASPDGRTILVQWSGECEIPLAFLVAVAEGRPVSVTGEYTRDDPPPNSTALGWSDDGRAIVFIPAESGCGGTNESGVFLIDLAGNKTRIAAASPDARLDLHRSLRTRSLDTIKREFAAQG
jgi:hypothetical protein